MSGTGGKVTFDGRAVVLDLGGILASLRNGDLPIAIRGLADLHLLMGSLVRACPRSLSLAVATVAGLSQEQVVDLDEVMRQEVPAYLGGLELDRGLPLHKLLFPAQDRYHLVGAELRLRYSAQSRAIAEVNGEDLDEPLDEWRTKGLFRSVVWEKDMEQSAAKEGYASLIFQQWLDHQAE